MRLISPCSRHISFLVFLIILAGILSCVPMDAFTGTQTSTHPDDRSMSALTLEGPFSPPTEDPVCLNTDKTLPEELTASEPEETVTIEVKGLKPLWKWEEGTNPAKEEKEVRYDFPVTMNRQVEFYLNFFQNQDRKSFAKWLARSGRYLPMIQQQLRDAGMPLDLAYLPMIESGYSLTAYSKARAVGPWQFIRSTGRLYGLTINNYVDERRDPIKSTRAAITFLSDLYAKFGSWHLAVAAYNAGAGRVNKAVRRGKTTNFWKLAQGRHLRLETKRYVPKLIAAIIIAKNPEEYGFTDIQYEEPLAFEYVKVPRWTSLQAASIAGKTPIKELRNLNRELRKGITPPGSSYQLKVPPGKLAIVEKNLPRVHATVSTKYKTHIVKGNETLSKVCKMYHIEKTILLKTNDLRGSKLVSGQRLRIPFRTTTYRLLAEKELPGNPDSLNLKNLVEHEVKTGETLSTIASRYGVPPHMIAAWNDIKNLHWIRAGQRLTLFVEDNALTPAAAPDRAAAKNKIARLETAGTYVSKAASAPTDNLTDSVPVSNSTYYMVRGGDTLWDIAKKYNTTPGDIRRWNQIEGDTIRPGRRLLLKVAQKDV